MGGDGEGGEQISKASIAAPQGLLPWGPSTRNKPVIRAPEVLHKQAITSFLALCPLNRPSARQTGSSTILKNITDVFFSQCLVEWFPLAGHFSIPSQHMCPILHEALASRPLGPLLLVSLNPLGQWQNTKKGIGLIWSGGSLDSQPTPQPSVGSSLSPAPNLLAHLPTLTTPHLTPCSLYSRHPAAVPAAQVPSAMPLPTLIPLPNPSPCIPVRPNPAHQRPNSEATLLPRWLLALLIPHSTTFLASSAQHKGAWQGRRRRGLAF